VNDDTGPITAYITSGDVDIVDGDNSMFIKRYIPDLKNQQGAVNFQFLVRQYPGATQTVASSTLVYSTTTKVDMRARGRQVAIKIISTEVDTKWRYRWSTGWFKIMAKLDQPRLANATPVYSQQQMDQIIRTLEQMVLQLNNTFTQDVQDIAEAQNWFMIGR
jgi:hypothetical protein